MPDKSRAIELISFDVPFPADYGGVIDVFYKLKAFKKVGIKVNLHCFEYGRKPSAELDKLCNNVYYYKRKVSKANLIRRKPYIVVSRESNQLLENLKKNSNPVLFEGLHSCFLLDHPALSGRRKIVRTHNIEHDYYSCLAKAESDIFKRYYFSNESQKLKKFQSVLEKADGIAAISAHDAAYFSTYFKNVKIVSAFHPHDLVSIKEGKGEFALYHGSLAVAENNKAALYLVNNIFKKINVPLVIAGNKPTQELINAVSGHPNISLRTNITTDQIYKLIEEAAINILPTFQATGIKLKLLAALYTGRHCIVNQPMVKDTGLDKLCIVADKDADVIKNVLEFMHKPFSRMDISIRKKCLEQGAFSNSCNMDQLAALLFD